MRRNLFPMRDGYFKTKADPGIIVDGEWKPTPLDDSAIARMEETLPPIPDWFYD